MIALTRRATIVVAALGLLATSPLATDGRADSAPADGKSEGTLTVNGKTTKVAFAYARSVPGFFDKNTNDTQVIVSDVPLDAKALADEFVRVSTGRQSGVGLGLALVRSLIGLHGGTVVLTSETGKGTTVVCRIPAAGPRAQQPVAA